MNIDIGKISGFNVIATINEPTAVAIAYGLENKNNKERKVFIFDFWWGTFDVIVLKIKRIKFDIINSDGDIHLGGENIDNLIAEYCIKIYKENIEVEVSSYNQKALKRLKREYVEVKHLLLITKEAIFFIECLSKEIDLNVTKNIEEFNNICEEIFERYINFFKNIKEIIFDFNASFSFGYADNILFDKFKHWVWSPFFIVSSNSMYVFYKSTFSDIGF